MYRWHPGHRGGQGLPQSGRAVLGCPDCPTAPAGGRADPSSGHLPEDGESNGSEILG